MKKEWIVIIILFLCLPFCRTVLLKIQSNISCRQRGFDTPACTDRPLVTTGKTTPNHTPLITVLFQHVKEWHSPDIKPAIIHLHPHETTVIHAPKPSLERGANQDVFHLFIIPPSPWVIIQIHFQTVPFTTSHFTTKI